MYVKADKWSAHHATGAGCLCLGPQRRDPPVHITHRPKLCNILRLSAHQSVHRSLRSINAELDRNSLQCHLQVGVAGRVAQGGGGGGALLERHAAEALLQVQQIVELLQLLMARHLRDSMLV